MTRHFYHNNGGRTCSRSVSFDYEDGKIRNIVFEAGCMGNTNGVSILADGKEPEEIIRLLKGTSCRGPSSCPNELALAVEEFLQELAEEEMYGDKEGTSSEA